MRGITVIVNRRSGTSTDESRAKVAAAFARAGLQPRMIVVDGDKIRGAAEAAAAAGHAIVAAGGDGTVSTVAAVAVATGVTFGVIPLGTLNHFARDAGIPLDVDAAVAAIAGGHVVALDTGELNGRTFVNNASVGFYARIVRARQLEQRRGHRKWIALAIGLMREARRFSQMTVRMTIDGRPVVRTTPFVFVGNGEYLDDGPGIGGRSAITAGHLWIAVAPECGRLQMLRLVVRAIAGRLAEDVRLEEFRGLDVTIEPRGPMGGVAVDGELSPAKPPFSCACRPAALHTLLPSS
jgi:diacylglycerol kinase family enzyme